MADRKLCPTCGLTLVRSNRWYHALTARAECPDPRTLDPAHLTVKQVEHTIGWPWAKWKGNCYAVATAIVEAGLVRGRAVYGHWNGRVAPTSQFYRSNQAAGFSRHGWIRLPDDRVVDATRWVFEDVPPYLFVGRERDADPECMDYQPLSALDYVCLTCGHVEEEHERSGLFRHCLFCWGWPYDEGGNRWRAENLTPVPAWNEDEKAVVLDLPREVSEWMDARLGGPPSLTLHQVRWVANLPLPELGEYAEPIFRALVEAGPTWAALIPLDNRMAVLGAKA